MPTRRPPHFPLSPLSLIFPLFALARRSKTSPLLGALLTLTPLFVALCATSSPLCAQELPSPPKKPHSVRITFLPPPLEGTLSVGVYDRSGKLIRKLHSEAPPSELAPSLNGLTTTWDGRDDQGTLVASGKYRVRGFVVGDLELSGEAFHANDWVTSEDTPRPTQFSRLTLQGDRLLLFGSDQNGQPCTFLHPLPDGALQVETTTSPAPSASTPPGPTSCPGKNGTRWVIEKILGEPVVVQLDASGEVARRLSIGAGEPSPVAIAASLEREEIFLLEKEGDRWRLRGLRKKQPTPEGTPNTGWETFLEKNRWPCARFAEASLRVGRAKPFVPEPSVTLQTQSNPLLSIPGSRLEVSLGTDADGCFLKTTDGLLLRRLTETAFLKWAVLGHDATHPALVLLQSDGSVIEEYRLRAPHRLMSFDAGEYQWPPR